MTASAHGKGIGVTQIDLVLGGAVLMMGVLDGNAHLLEREHGIAAQIARRIKAGQIEVSAAVEHFGAFRILEIVVFELGAYVERVALWAA